MRVNSRRGQKTNLGVANDANWVFTLNRTDDVGRFCREVGFADKLKQRKLEDALRLRGELGAVGAGGVWPSKYTKLAGDRVAREGVTASS